MLPLPIAALFLIAVNTIPLFGVLLFGWSLFSIMFLYWLENGIVGFFNVFRIALARAPRALQVHDQRPLSIVMRQLSRTARMRSSQASATALAAPATLTVALQV